MQQNYANVTNKKINNIKLSIEINLKEILLITWSIYQIKCYLIILLCKTRNE